jgi:hypothetical protein
MILMGFSIINHPFWGIPIAGNPHWALSRTKLQKVSHSRNMGYIGKLTNDEP